MNMLKFPNWDQANRFLSENGYERSHQTNLSQIKYFAKFIDSGATLSYEYVTARPNQDGSVVLEIVLKMHVSG